MDENKRCYNPHGNQIAIQRPDGTMQIIYGACCLRTVPPFLLIALINACVVLWSMSNIMDYAYEVAALKASIQWGATNGQDRS
jgi:hypothetical protein